MNALLFNGGDKEGIQVELLNPAPRPGRSAQELETGAYRWVVVEAADVDLLAKLLPAKVVNEGF